MAVKSYESLSVIGNEKGWTYQAAGLSAWEIQRLIMEFNFVSHGKHLNDRCSYSQTKCPPTWLWCYYDKCFGMTGVLVRRENDVSTAHRVFCLHAIHYLLWRVWHLDLNVTPIYHNDYVCVTVIIACYLSLVYNLDAERTMKILNKDNRCLAQVWK
jgi:hypothetical protein